MSKKYQSFTNICVFLLIFLLLLGCTPVANTINEDKTEIASSANSEEEASSANESTETEQISTAAKTGGTIVIGESAEPDTLDPHKTHITISEKILQMLGSSLVALDLDGNVIPYVATEWKTSEDGLTWEFTLRQDVIFQDGTPVTANDFAWTYNRAIDPETASPAAGEMLGDVNEISAVDDFTLKIVLNEPYYPFLLSLASPGYLMPLSQKYIEEVGEDGIARNPLSTGPYLLKEWSTGEKVVLERNPDYTWGPEIGENTGPFYIETIEYRVINEYATRLAGLESGDIDILAIEQTDYSLFNDSPDYYTYDYLLPGIQPYLAFNLEIEPYTDIEVRKALNLAIDRQAMIEIMLAGDGVIQYGPISESVLGYWDGVKEIGYNYDPEQAAVHMENAGYLKNDNGYWEKDGQVLSIPLTFQARSGNDIKLGELVQEQFKSFGIEIELISVESGVYSDTVLSGNFSMCVADWEYNEADIMFFIFHSAMIDALNVHRINSPELDNYLELGRIEINPEKRQEAVSNAQKWVVENAIILPLYTPVKHIVSNSRISSLLFSLKTGSLIFSDAYITE